MAQHRKPTRHRTRTMLVVIGPIVGLPLTTGVAHAAPLDWSDVSSAIQHCESGGRATATNPRSTASGLYGFLDSTWRAMGGSQYSRRAKDATPAQQEAVARRLFLRAGTPPWNASRSCWRHRIGKPKPKPVAPPQRLPGRVYTVVPGDTLSEIAARTGHTWQDLLEANKADIADPNRISIGLSINLL